MASRAGPIIRDFSGSGGTVMTSSTSNLAQELGVALGASSVERDGRNIVISYTRPRRNQRPEVRLTVNVDDSATPGVTGRKRAGTRPVMVLRKETGTDRFGKSLGLNREVQTGDSLFDAE